MSAATRAALLGWLMLGLALVVVVGPFLWIAVASFKQPIAILSGTWSFTHSTRAAVAISDTGSKSLIGS